MCWRAYDLRAVGKERRRGGGRGRIERGGNVEEGSRGKWKCRERNKREN